jgi:hypothetical protein
MAELQVHGWWIGPDGRVIEVPGEHRDLLFDSPRRFGLRPGPKREKDAGGIWDTMQDLVRAGWMRVRHAPWSDRWLFQIGSRRKQSPLIADFLADIGASADDAVLVTLTGARENEWIWEGRVAEIWDGALLA